MVVDALAMPRTQPVVLLVEDCPDNRDMYAAYLVRRGFTIEEAEDGQRAIEKAQSVRPDCIVMDLSLPDMDGTEAIRAIRGNERSSPTPIIVVSGYSAPEAGAMGGGWDLFLSKPCAPDLLAQHISRLVKSRETP